MRLNPIIDWKRECLRRLFIVCAIWVALVLILGLLAYCSIARYWQDKLASDDPDDRIHALEFFRYAEAVQVAHLTDEDERVRIASLRHLAGLYDWHRGETHGHYDIFLERYNAHSADLVRAILGLTLDDHPQVREEAFKALGKILTNPALVIPALIDRMDQDQSPSVRSSSGRTLTEYCRKENLPIIAPYLPTLLLCLDHPDPEVISSAICAIGELRFVGADVFLHVCRKLGDKRVRDVAIRVLDHVWDDKTDAKQIPDDSIDALADFVWDDDPDPTVVEKAVVLLGKCGTRSKKHVHLLIACYSREALRFAILESLGLIGDASAVPFLRKVLQGAKNEVVRKKASQALSRLLENGGMTKADGPE